MRCVWHIDTSEHGMVVSVSSYRTSAADVTNGDDLWLFFFFQAEDGIRDLTVTGVQTCALPILFTFGTCGKPLCLTGALAGHGNHFIPADTASGSSILNFISNAIGASVGNTPLTSDRKSVV